MKRMPRPGRVARPRRAPASRLRAWPVAKLSRPTTFWPSRSSASSRLRADEAGAAGDQPAAGLRVQRLANAPCSRCVGQLTGARRSTPRALQRLRVGRALHVDVARRRRRSLASIVVERTLAELPCARPRRRWRRPAAARPTAPARRRTRAALPSASATGSCTCTVHAVALQLADRRRSPCELRRSGQFSLNVRPSTMTSAPLTGSPAGSSA